MNKNPVVAAILNFLLYGAGYIYNGKRTGLGVTLTVGLVLLRYADIRIFLSEQNRMFWFFMLTGMFLLQVGLAIDAYREAKEMSATRSTTAR